MDEAYFLGGLSKDKVLKAFGAHIFFDDQDTHVLPASQLVPSARVPYTSDSPLNIIKIEKDRPSNKRPSKKKKVKK